MKVYHVNNWDLLFENNRTRDLKKLDWVPIPNKQDGDGYTMIMEMENGPAIFGTWIALVQVASRCGNPAGRGVLMRDGGKPHDSASLSRMTRVPEHLITLALEVLADEDINWLIVKDIEVKEANPALGCDNPALGCLEGKGREGKEGKGMEAELPYPEIAFPSWEEWWAYSQRIGLGAEWKARDEWQKQESKQWAGIQKWQAHASRVRTWWESDGRPMQPRSKKPGKNKGPNI